MGLVKESGIKIFEQKFDDPKQRAEDFVLADTYQIGESGIFTSVNINAWRSAFNTYLKNQMSVKRFSIKLTGKHENEYRVWRLSDKK